MGQNRSIIKVVRYILVKQILYDRGLHLAYRFINKKGDIE